MAAVVAIAEGHLAVLDPFQTAVADGNAKDIAAQIFEHLLALARVLAMHHPVLVPDLRRHLLKQACLFESRADLGAEDH